MLKKKLNFLGSDTLNKWHHLASQNVTGGINSISEPKDEIPKINLEERLSLNDNQNQSSIKKLDNLVFPEQIMQSQTLSKNSTHDATANSVGLFGDLDQLRDKRTIITRTSNALTSLRQGRTLLKDKDQNKSKSEVIGMIANAMSKVNVEAKTGRRILESLSESPKSHIVSPRTEYKDMPNVSRALTKAAERKISESHTSGVPLEDMSSFSSASMNNHAGLDSVGGPLGLINRTDPTDLPAYSHRLLRFSGYNSALELKDENLDSVNNIDLNLSPELDDASEMQAKQTTINNGSQGNLANLLINSKLRPKPNPFGFESAKNFSDTKNNVNATSITSESKTNDNNGLKSGDNNISLNVNDASEVSPSLAVKSNSGSTLGFLSWFT